MRFLLPFLLAVIGALTIFAFTDEPGSGIGKAIAFFAVIMVGACCYNKWHNGTWFTDASGGK